MHVDDFAELATTLRYMAKKGVDRVRGGPFSNVILSPKQLDQIKALMHFERYKMIPKDEGQIMPKGTLIEAFRKQTETVPSFSSTPSSSSSQAKDTSITKMEEKFQMFDEKREIAKLLVEFGHAES